MAKNLYSFVLEDNLFLEYNKFMNPKQYNEEYDKDIIKKLLSYCIYPFLYNKRQVERLHIDIPINLKSRLYYASNKNKELTTLVDDTVFKCILSIEKNEFPYININSDKIRTSITGTFFSSENRNKAIDHIAKLCKDAKTITLHDKYMTVDDIHQLCELFPTKKNLTIQIHSQDISDGGAYKFSDIYSELCKHCKDWTIEPKELSVYSHHDRYMIIDDNLAIILTSGYHNLFSGQKDITYIVTHIAQNPLIKK